MIRTTRKKFLQILSDWNSCHWVLLNLILLSSGLQSIPSSPSFQSRYPAVCKLLSPCQCCINYKQIITNKLSHKSCYTSGGKCSTTDTIYAAECTRHSMIYVGQSSQKLNSLFNGHRSDVKVKPKACELSQHFHNNKECRIDRDLKVYILQDNVTGSWEKREYFEDHWITRLNSKAPNGMNFNLKEFAKTFYALF